MKKLITSIFLALSFLITAAQTPKKDVILKANGEQMEGKLIKVTDSDVTFVTPAKLPSMSLKNLKFLKLPMPADV